MAFSRSALGHRLMELHGAGSPSNRAIADTLLRNPLHASAWGIEEFAAAAGVSPATLSRFARVLGFGGYAELRSAIAATMQSIVNPIEKLRGRFAPAAPDAPTPLTEGLETLLSNARATAEGLTPALVDEVVARLTAAKTVYVMGFGLSAHVAALLALGLQPFCTQLQNVVEFGGTEVAAGRLLNVGAGDVLVVLSIPRYASDAVHLTAYARDRQASVIAITDFACLTPRSARRLHIAGPQQSSRAFQQHRGACDRGGGHRDRYDGFEPGQREPGSEAH